MWKLEVTRRTYRKIMIFITVAYLIGPYLILIGKATPKITTIMDFDKLILT